MKRTLILAGALTLTAVVASVGLMLAGLAAAWQPDPPEGD